MRCYKSFDAATYKQTSVVADNTKRLLKIFSAVTLSKFVKI